MVDELNARLESWYVPARHAAGTMRLRVVNLGRRPLEHVTLAFDSIVALSASPSTTVDVVARHGGHHEVALPPLHPGQVWESGPLACGQRPVHANDGPVGAFLRHADGTTQRIHTSPTAYHGDAHSWSAPVPGLRCAADAAPEVRDAWAIAGDVERRVFAAPMVLGDAAGDVVDAAIDPHLDAEAYDVSGGDTGGAISIVAGSRVALQWALVTLARARRARRPLPVGTSAPRWSWRGLHLDVARQFVPAVDVEWAIAIAASRRCNRLHLHLTDDEGWRLPVPAVPALTDVGAFRGEGLSIPALLGSGPAASGGSYTAADIAGWVALAADVGVELVPEIDLPGHGAAALAAVPALIDPADTSTAASVQHYANNTLNPGLPATWDVLTAVFEAVAATFGGRWLHLGGDEVAADSWTGSPAAQAWAAARELDGSSASIERAFMVDVIDLARRTTGATIVVWQEAADSGALAPGDGHVIAWKSTADCRRLAAAGHTVVAAPADRFYLDMAADPEWSAPGTGWAGHASVADLEHHDVTAGWSEAEQAHLRGVHACLWGEHLPDRPSIERMLLPRFDRIADAAWTTT